ncbi:MAG: hypothetical protein K9N55_12305 [Phycisphaerae bacterium]|nr:hypothetical protein [Phycisphaerae bacterium]
MKRIGFISLIVLCCGVVFAGPRDGLWRDVDKALDSGLPVTAINLLDQIIPQALEEQAHAEAIRAICLKIVLQGDIQGGAPEERIIRLQAELIQAPEAMKPVMEAVLAHWFWQYFQQNRWRYIQRTQTSEPPGDDIQTWDLTRILAEIDAHFSAALADDQALKAISIAQYDDLLERGTVQDSVRPTLYDFLVHEALSFYAAGEQAAYRPADYFEIMADSPVFAPLSEFLAWTPVTTQQDSPKLRAIHLYQDLLSFHQSDSDPIALVEADLGRLRFAGNTAIGPDRDAIYMAALERFVGQWGNHDTAAEALHGWASVLLAQGDTAQAYALAAQGWDQYPASYGGILCYNLIQQIEGKSVTMATERVWNAPWPDIQVTYKNVDSVYFRAVPYDIKTRRTLAGDYLSTDEKQALLLEPPVAQWQAELTETPDFKSRTESVNVPDDLPKGSYYIIASHRSSFTETNNQLSFTPICVSDLALVTRHASGEGVVNGFVVSARTGSPIHRARVSAWQYDDKSGRQEEIRVTYTDANGMFDFSHDRDTSGFLIGAEYQGDTLFSEAQYSMRQPVPPPGPAQRTVFFTDRSLYRPGQTVQYKGICLTQNTTTDQYQVLAGGKLSVVFRDTSYQEIARYEHRCNDYGAFSGSFIAPSDRLLGRMTLTVDQGPFGYAPVQVEAYKRPTFQVEINAPVDAPRLNDEIMMPARAAAYTGAPVGGAQVTWHVERTLRFPRWCWWVPVPQSQVIGQGSCVTRVDGTFDIPFTARPDLSVLAAHEPVFLYSIHADVTDTAGETRSVDSLIRIGYTALQASLDAHEWQTATRPVVLTVTTESLDAAPEAAACTVSVYTLRQPDAVVRAPLAYPAYGYRSYGLRPASDDTHPETWDLETQVFTAQVTTDALGQATVSAPLGAGIYRAVLETEDRFGQSVTANKTITVVDPEASHFAVRVPNHVTANAWSVEPGDTFVGLWGTGYDQGRAFVEIECRGQVLSAGWTDTQHTQQMVELPVTEDMRGGVTIRWTYVRDNRAYVTERIVTVPWTNKTLSVVWKRFRSRLLPGQDEQWTAVITGPDAKKAVAEMVVGLYDASLDQLLPHTWLQTIGGFRQETSRLTSAFANSARQFSVLFSQWQIASKGVVQTYRHFPDGLMPLFPYWGPVYTSGGGRDGDSSEVNDTDKANNTPPNEPLVAPVVNLDQIVARKEFHETAFFYPHLRSDSNGEVNIEFTLPEDLTEWRFLGFAHDQALRSGFLTDTMVTAKDLMIQANAPRFVREGDVIEFPVKVTNQSAARQTGQVRLTFSNVRTEAAMDAVLGNVTPEQAFDVPSQETRTYTWRITIPDGCETLAYRAVGATTRLSDGEEAYLPVLSRRQLVIESLPLPIRGAQTKAFEFDSLLASGQSESLQHQSLTVQMVSQPAWYAVMALPYLMEHPQRSTDQLFHRYYANSLAAYIANSDPRIRTVFDQWKNTDALDSPLDKNEDLKAVLLEETPWVRQADSESQARRHVGILFDGNRLTQELSSVMAELKDRQYASGLWPWYPGGRANEYITLRIVCGFGRLRHLGVDLDVSRAIKALDALDGWVYDYLTRGEEDRHVARPAMVLYLYARSFFLDDAPVKPELWAELQPELDRLREVWLDLPRQCQAQLALALKRFGDLDTTPAIMASIRQHSVQDEELGMFWRDLERHWSWFHAPIETQAMMIEAFDEVEGDAEAVDACQVWLLKQKQTQHWKTTVATVDAIYALLVRGNSLLASNEIVDVALAGQWITPQAIEAGTGFYETRFSGSQIEPAMGHVTVKKLDDGVSWGSVHWQYLEDVGKIAAYDDTPLQLIKMLYTKKNTTSGPVLFPVQGALAVGDELVVRVELRVDRDMEYVHLKDQRGSGTEPVAALSGYRYQDGLGYYESVSDTAADFFIAYLPKGTYVFEYSTRVQLKGQYQSGIASIQCLYAPEFNSHSQSFELNVQ